MVVKLFPSIPSIMEKKKNTRHFGINKMLCASKYEHFVFYMHGGFFQSISVRAQTLKKSV